MTIEHQQAKNYKDFIIPNTRVCVIIRRPPTNISVTVQYNENNIRDTIADNNDEQLTTSGTAESSIEYVPNLDMSKEHQMLDMISPQNHDPIPLETSIFETMGTNNDYIDMNFAELPDKEERPLTSKIQSENLEKEDTMGFMKHQMIYSNKIQHVSQMGTNVEYCCSEETNIRNVFLHDKAPSVFWWQ